MVNQGRRAGDTVEGDWEQVEANVEVRVWLYVLRV